MTNDLLCYVGQKAFIEKDGKILTLFDVFGLDFPGGKIQEDENNLIESLKREVREETGLEIEVGDIFCTWIITLPENHKYAGKKIYLVGYKCTYLSGAFKLSNEHSNYTWIGKDTYRDLDDGTDYFKALEKYFDKK